MRFVVEDIIILVSALLLLLISISLKSKLPNLLMIRDKSQVPVFSIKRDKGVWITFGIGLYVWVVEFFILNERVLLRLYSVILIQVTLFSLFIIGNLGYPKFSRVLALITGILFLFSLGYYI
ncbi:hypothetical protein [Halonatronum saccharophilum]|uniref:hypothetical protein n=1 Tax=Halonatronum saccharophilum TaxID=150060 RepID=UPI0004856786|nr:hypothetical protein [Halonatronum saccharophilum]